MSECCSQEPPRRFQSHPSGRETQDGKSSCKTAGALTLSPRFYTDEGCSAQKGGGVYVECPRGRVSRCRCKAERRFHSLCVTAAKAQTALPSSFPSAVRAFRAVQEPLRTCAGREVLQTAAGPGSEPAAALECEQGCGCPFVRLHGRGSKALSPGEHGLSESAFAGLPSAHRRLCRGGRGGCRGRAAAQQPPGSGVSNLVCSVRFPSKTKAKRSVANSVWKQ